MKEYVSRHVGNQPALKQDTEQQRQVQWREWACTMACEVSKTHPEWVPFDILNLAGGLLEMIINGPPTNRKDADLDDDSP